MKKFILSCFLLMLIASTFYCQDKFVTDKAEIQVQAGKSITIFRAAGFLRHYNVTTYRIQNIGNVMLTVIYGGDRIELNGGCSLDIGAENQDLIIKNTSGSDCKANYRIVYLRE